MPPAYIWAVLGVLGDIGGILGGGIYSWNGMERISWTGYIFGTERNGPERYMPALRIRIIHVNRRTLAKMGQMLEQNMLP